MEKSIKQECLLKLMIIALNEAINKGYIDLYGRSASPLIEGKNGYLELTVLEKRTVLNWCDAGYEELRVSVWWDYTPELMPTEGNRYLKELKVSTPKPSVPHRFYGFILGACGSCYLERRTRKCIIGDMGKQFFDVYMREGSERILKNVELVEPNGYQTNGWIKE